MLNIPGIGSNIGQVQLRAHMKSAGNIAGCDGDVVVVVVVRIHVELNGENKTKWFYEPIFKKEKKTKVAFLRKNTELIQSCSTAFKQL